jgi:hypothetical protein
MTIGLLSSMLWPQSRKLAGKASGYMAACYRGGAAALRRFKCQYGSGAVWYAYAKGKLAGDLDKQNLSHGRA